MIKYFAVENYKSIKNKAILEFDSNLAEDYPYPASAVIGFAGANASGKTTILQAISFVFWFMQESFSEIKEDQAIPIRPFATTSDLPSNFHLIFTQKNSENNYIDYEYLLTVNQEKILKEEVYYYPNNDQELVYKREEQQVQFGKDIHILNEDVTSALRPKNSIISFLAQFPSQDKAKTFQKYLFVTNINAQGGFKDLQFNLSVARNLMNKSNNTFDLLDILKIADIGIEGINIEGTENAEILLSILESMISNVRQLKILESLFDLEKEIKTIESIRVMFKKYNQFLVDRFLDSISKEKEQIKFKHKIDNSFVELLDSNQSEGTLKLLALLERIQLAFNQGYLLIIDEIELKLHQNLIAYLIGLFENSNQNIEGGQLLFSFHNTALMEILQPNQLWFTEKNDQGQTEIFSAADFTDIKDIQQRNLEELYRIGRFGAKPRAL